MYNFIKRISPQNIILPHQFFRILVLAHNICIMIISEKKLTKVM